MFFSEALTALARLPACVWSGGSLGGLLGSMNPMNLMPFGSEKEEKDASEDKDSSD